MHAAACGREGKDGWEKREKEGDERGREKVEVRSERRHEREDKRRKIYTHQNLLLLSNALPPCHFKFNYYDY